MKILFMLWLVIILLTSCGGKIPVMSSVMEEWGKEKNKESFENLMARKYLLCSQESYARACTRNRPRPTLFQPYEFFGPWCHRQYVACLGGRKSTNTK